MKKMLWIMVIAFAVALTFTTCDDGTKSGGGGIIGGGGGGPSFLGDSLTLSGQVYELFSYNNGSNSYYVPFTGSQGITDSPAGGSGAITNGQLTYTIGTPNDASLETYSSSSFINGLTGGYTNIQPSNSNVKIFMLDLLLTRPSYDSYDIVVKANITTSYSTIMTSEVVVYVYVDGDITISGTGKTQTVSGRTNITNNFSLALKQGWNAVYVKDTNSGTTHTQNISLRNPNLKWMLANSGPITPGPGPNPGTGGTFTLSGIPSEHNGKYASLSASLSNTVTVFGGQNMATGILISNGSVNLPMGTLNMNNGTIGSYSGNDTCFVSIIITNAPDSFMPIGMITFTDVTFANGSASRTWNEGQYDDIQ